MSKTKNKLISKPPTKNTEEDQAKLDSFINAAKTSDKNSKKEVSVENFPWENPSIREDVKKQFILRLPEPHFLKLKFISEKTGKSMHKILIDSLIPTIDEELNNII
ncbi:MAG: hypothetical protein DWQ06_01085 [Calditrichaeota bacterium]|nr:MAG: hypothetical protein DWQ06_01085 [Calditrichota bacterium]